MIFTKAVLKFGSWTIILSIKIINEINDNKIIKIIKIK